MLELCLDSPTPSPVCLHGMHWENYTLKFIVLILIRGLNNAMITLITITPDQLFIKVYSRRFLSRISSARTLSEILPKLRDPHMLYVTLLDPIIGRMPSDIILL